MTSDRDPEAVEEYKKLCAAREIWPKRNEMAPVSKVPWHQWFKRKFGENLFQYVERKRAEKARREGTG